MLPRCRRVSKFCNVDRRSAQRRSSGHQLIYDERSIEHHHTRYLEPRNPTMAYGERRLFRREGIAYARSLARRNRAYRLTPRPTPRDNVTADAFTDSERSPVHNDHPFRNFQGRRAYRMISVCHNSPAANVTSAGIRCEKSEYPRLRDEVK